MMGKKRRARTLSPLGAVVRGAIAGICGTAAMDLVQYVEYRGGGGDDGFGHWEFEAVDDWDSAPAPAQVGKRIAEGLLSSEVPPSAVNTFNNAVHWGYGTLWGIAYGVVAGSTSRRRARWGSVFGTGVWLAGYGGLPPTGLYQPISEYDPGTLAKDWAHHFVYGMATAAAFRALSGAAS